MARKKGSKNGMARWWRWTETEKGESGVYKSAVSLEKEDARARIALQEDVAIDTIRLSQYGGASYLRRKLRKE